MGSDGREVTNHQHKGNRAMQNQTTAVGSDSGRTIRQAIDDGTYYVLSGNGFASIGFPAARSPMQALACLQSAFKVAESGLTFRVQRVTGGQIGCYVVEDCGSVATA
jgi:hypothetical protein